MSARGLPRILPRSLAVRVTLLCGLIAIAVTGMLGAHYYFAARVAIVAHADDQLIGRVEHFRRLVVDARTVRELRDQSMLFESVLGTAGDVLILRRTGEPAPLVSVNPNQMLPPACMAQVAASNPIGKQDVCESASDASSRMRWVSGMVASGHGGEMIQVVGGHPLAEEAQMILKFRNQVVFSTALAVLACSALVYAVLRHGLRPLRRIAAQAAMVQPINLAIRLPHDGVPSELQEMVEAINAMLDRIAVGFERLSQFSGDLAHEIRTPVGALIGQTQVTLNRARSVDEYQEVLESNLEELNRLRLIVDNILFLAQADHATLRIDREPWDVPAELVRIADYFEGPADENNLRILVEADGSAHVNPALCRRALHNLVANAVRYGTPGTPIRLYGSGDDGGYTIGVENEALPIPPQQLERLFDRFYRADAVRTRPSDSSGLGLAIVKAIMDLHGGAVRASCTAGGTIRFELRFLHSVGAQALA